MKIGSTPVLLYCLQESSKVLQIHRRENKKNSIKPLLISSSVSNRVIGAIKSFILYWKYFIFRHFFVRWKFKSSVFSQAMLIRAQYQYFKSLVIGWFIKFFFILLTSLVIGLLRYTWGAYDWLRITWTLCVRVSEDGWYLRVSESMEHASKCFSFKTRPSLKTVILDIRKEML